MLTLLLLVAFARYVEAAVAGAPLRHRHAVFTPPLRRHFADALPRLFA